KTPLKVRLGLYEDETSALCDWHIPAVHFLESWGDARGCDGTVSLVQPLIAPLYDGKTATELLAALSGQPGRTAYNIVKEYWREQSKAPNDFEDQWQTALHEGVMTNTAFPALNVNLLSIPKRPDDAQRADADQRREGLRSGDAESVDLLFRPDPTIYDGRFANNAWLQELPKPFTKLTWDNAALIGPRLAERLGLKNGDVVDIQHYERRLQTPIWIAPGQAEGVVTLHLGYGRSRGGRVASGIGVNAYVLQSFDSPWSATGATLRAVGRRESLACTQTHHWMEGRDLVRSGTVEQARDHPESFKTHEEKPATTLFPQHEYEGYKWAMTIDLNRCTGCNACVVACQAENNIPVVGKDQVERGREMHWIRVDTYYEGEPENPQAVHQPLPCMHCENAPCEVVCPVGATLHDKEGLNEMVYNRCVGTRYCSNNCPYKVRRFNFLQYSDLTTPSLKLMRNPEVTVRNRGVMEKCTYCIQRISAARIDSEKRDSKLIDGQLVTACQAACPSQAITFGNLNESDSRIAHVAADPLNYALLGELNTRPRTTYLPVVRNPNPQLLG
ncbi:MAG TPA: 4Fe-4S dicluster domain-containing protein, partial [Pirellulales bacterium]